MMSGSSANEDAVARNCRWMLIVAGVLVIVAVTMITLEVSSRVATSAVGQAGALPATAWTERQGIS
jgi:hypothetical protein